MGCSSCTTNASTFISKPIFTFAGNLSNPEQPDPENSFCFAAESCDVWVPTESALKQQEQSEFPLVRSTSSAQQQQERHSSHRYYYTRHPAGISLDSLGAARVLEGTFASECGISQQTQPEGTYGLPSSSPYKPPD